MKDVWNLDVIYRGFDDPVFASDMQALEETVKGFDAFASSLEELDTLEGLREGITWEERITELGMKLAYMLSCGSPSIPGTVNVLPVWAR